MSVRFFPSYTSNPAPRRSLAPAARVGTRFLEPWAWADLEGRVQSYYWAHREAPPGLLPGRWGPGSPVPRPPPNPLARSSCSLWAWALCFPGFWSPPLFRTRRERVLWTPWGGGWGVDPWFLGIAFTLGLQEGRGPWIRPWGGRRDSRVHRREKGLRGFGIDIAPDTSATGSGLGSRSPGLRSLDNNRV